MAEAKNKKTKPIRIGKQRFESLSAAALALGLKKHTLYHRLKMGYTEEQLRAPIRYTTGQQQRESRNIMIDGKLYGSIQEAAEKLGINYQTLYARIKNGTHVDKLSTCQRINGNAQSVMFNGKSYPTIKAFCEEYQLPYAKVQYRISKGMTPAQIIKLMQQ